MITIEGQIESLKKMKEILGQNRITRFTSIKDLKLFQKNYEIERNSITENVEDEISSEINALHDELEKKEKLLKKNESEVSNQLTIKIKKFASKCNIFENKKNKSPIFKFIFLFLASYSHYRKIRLEKNFQKIVNRKIAAEKKRCSKTNKRLNEYIDNRTQIVSERCSLLFKQLEYTKNVVESLNTLIAGAIGENLVVKELENLSNNFFLFNDYSLQFTPPIYNKKERDRIYSIQIDHLLITNSGVFILETKNWSKKSIEKFDLRSPIKQIQRTSFALFVVLNSESKFSNIKLKHHHWGKKQIPIRNVVVMINQKPREKFKYVSVKTLNELKSYILYFEPIFSDNEVASIADYLRNKVN